MLASYMYKKNDNHHAVLILCLPSCKVGPIICIYQERRDNCDFPRQFTIRKPKSRKKMVGGVGDFSLSYVIRKKNLRVYND